MKKEPTEEEKQQTLFWDWIGAIIVVGAVFIYKVFWA